MSVRRLLVVAAVCVALPVLMADEPTSALNLGATSAMARLLRGLADDGLAIVLVVHDLAPAAAIADEVVVISDGRSVATGPPAEVLHSERLREVWHVDAELEGDGSGRTALHVRWLEGQPSPGARVAGEALAAPPEPPR